VNLKYFINKRVLITGGTGSIGTSLVKNLMKSKCKTIRVMTNDENALYEISRDLNLSLLNSKSMYKSMYKNKIRLFLGDVRDFKRCVEVTKKVDIVIHAAALKHVSIMEYNPSEAIQTNVKGTKNIVLASIKNNVSKLLHISTDKVVYAESVMGKTKFMAEKFISNLIKNSKNKKTKISIIRFGNVLGSRGSVIPNFIHLLKSNKKITVTDKKMKRFVMTLNDSVKLVLKSITIMKGSEIFIMKSMKCFKIYDLALALKRYFKKKNKIIISKKLDGEKYEEELYTEKEIPFIEIKNNLFIIRNKLAKQNSKKIELLKKFRVSNFNFLNEDKIIFLLKRAKII
jgi:UDP-N-acetylglucosamine 4,6-dehydratase/5-epimerase